MQNKPKDIKYCGVSEDKILNSQPILNTESLDLFTHWIEERYKVHLRKDAGKPKPWTKDKILANYRFTNVRREQDRQTKYLINNIVNNDNLTIEEKITNIIVFRCWNLWDTMKSFGGPWTIKQFNSKQVLKGIEATYEHIKATESRSRFYTNVFFTSGFKRITKIKYKTTQAALTPFYIGHDAARKGIPEKILSANSPIEVCKILRTLPGIAGFLSYQMFVDMTYIKEFPFSENEFTIAGPGCKNGLRRLFNSSDDLTPEELIFWLRNNLSEVAPQFNPKEFMTDLPTEERFLSVMSLENCLCEFSKYHRAYFGQGRPKQKYIPTKE